MLLGREKKKYPRTNIVTPLFCRLSADEIPFLYSSELIVTLFDIDQGKGNEYKDKVLQEWPAVSIERAIYVKMHKLCKKRKNIQSNTFLY